MIVIQMSGGLGNQMFQYALFLKLRSLGREVVFDDRTQYDREAFRNSSQKRRPKQLDVFGIRVPTVQEEDLIRLTDAAMDPISRLRRKLRGRRSLEKRDQDFIFDASFLRDEEGYYCGGFQSPRYFAGVEEEVRRAFAFPDNVLTPGPQDAANRQRIYARAAQYAERIREANRSSAGGSASIHLRFGDYLDKPEIYGGICTDAYYEEAIRLLKERDPETTFFVFSNDLARAGEWVRRQAEKEENRGRSRFVLVSGSDEEHGWLDLYLMTLCRSHIIANSSFSWWGAWLGAGNSGADDGRRGITFAPSIWVHTPGGRQPCRNDIYDAGMRRINPNGQEITERPLLSVIVTAYNVAPYVDRAVSSVCAQSYRNLELIAVDDGSTDGTGERLDALAGQDERIRVIHTANRGVAAARNTGLRAAEGELIGFVDGDDAAHPDMYETMVRGMMETGADMCTVNYREVAPGGSMADADGTDNAADTGDTARTGEIDRALASSVLWNRRQAVRVYIHAGLRGTDEDAVFHSAVWSKVFRRKTVEAIAFPEGTSAEDIPFTTGAVCASGRVLYIPAPLYDYSVKRGGSIMSGSRARRTLEDEIPAWQTHLRLLRAAGEEELADESEFYYYRRLLSYDEDYRRCSGTDAEEEELRRRILDSRDRILELTDRGKYGRRGDRARMKLFVLAPALYRLASGLYERTVIAVRSRKEH